MGAAVWMYLAIYIVAVIALSIYFAKKDGLEDFLIANRDRKWWAIAFSKFAAGIGVTYFVAYTGYAYKYGIGVYAIILGLVVGYLLFALWAVPRLYEIGRENRLYTQGGWLVLLPEVKEQNS